MMRSIWTAICKDLLCLWRDPGALATLFIMPAALVVVISLVQNDTITAMSGADSTLIVIDKARDSASRGLVEALGRSGFVLVSERDDADQPFDEQQALALLEKGRVEAVLFIEPDALERVKAETARRIQVALGQSGNGVEEEAWLRLQYRHDLLDASRLAINGAATMALSAVRSEALLHAVSELRGANPDDTPPPVPRIETGITSSYWPEGRRSEPLSASEQNLPAWVLFAMFFMVLPIASGVIRERRSGTLDRLLSLRVPYATLLGGRIGAYVMIALLQALVIGLVGWYVLPLLGVERPDFVVRPFATLLLLLASALAAAGAGVVLGTIASSEEQSSVFGALSVVLLSAMGGIMVPLFAMPRLLRQLAVVSPLNWGHEALVQVLVRDVPLVDVAWPMARLLIFFVACVGLAVAYQRRQHA